MTQDSKGIALAVVGSRPTKASDRESFDLARIRIDKVRRRVWRKLDRLHENIGIRLIVSGRAFGPDKYAEEWAIDRGVPTEIFLPDWNKHGKSAGFIRNADIVEACDRLLAFWDGRSKGTEHSINLARKKSRPRKVIKLE
jgi:hypothetical protein